MSKLFGIPVGDARGRARRRCSWSRSASSRCSRCATASSCGSGVRNVRRRRGRSALIVVGLMLGTAIIAAALATGDTMSQTIRSSARARRSAQTDEVVAREGRRGGARGAAPAATGARYFPQALRATGSRARRRGSGSSTASRPAIIEPVAVQDSRAARTSRG